MYQWPHYSKFSDASESRVYGRLESISLIIIVQQKHVAAADREGQTAAAACTLLLTAVSQHDTLLPTCTYMQ